MRLRLTIQRHGLPPVQLLWTAGHILPAPYAAAGNSITISQFVEQVNDIIPLESDDWGLEDYAVEVRGFECLHFSEVGQVLKEDDEVCIRPLQTSDLRIRKVLGRHQISANGKHLIDGVAYGRPFLRIADRPPIRIPPRKRRRLTYEEEEDAGEPELSNDRQILVRAGFDDADEAMAGDESDDDEDFAPDDEDDEDLHAELEDLQRNFNADVDEGGAAAVGDVQIKHTRNTRSRKSVKGLGLLALVDENGHPFPGEYENPLLDKYNQDKPSPTEPALKVKKRGSAKLAQDNREHVSHGVQESSASSFRISRRSSTGSNKSVRFGDAEAETPATVRELEDSDEDDDSDFEPAGVNDSDKENAKPQDEETGTSDDSFGSSDSSSSAFSKSQLSDSEETSSSGTSSSDSTSDSEPEEKTSNPTKQRSNSSQTSSSRSSSSDTDSNSDDEHVAKERKAETSRPDARNVFERKAFQKYQWALGNVTPKPNQEKTASIQSSVPKSIPPGKGAKRTKARNQRRKESKKLAFLKREGLLPADATKVEYLKFIEGEDKSRKTDELVSSKKLQNEDVGDVEFEAKRQALLDSIASGGIDMTPAQDKTAMEPKMSQTDGQPLGDNDAMEVEAPVTVVTDHDDAMDDVPANASRPKDMEGEQVQTESATDTPISGLEGNLNGDPAPTSAPRRSKLDLSSTKRMLFGSLGLRTPKTKEDESKMREQLTKNSKIVKNPRLDQEIESTDDVEAAAADDSWKDKIDLRAVECCHEGIELSTPPFPFVQRWDPQQQGGYSYSTTKKRKQKKRKRNDNSYYEECPYQSSQSKATPHDPYGTPSHASAQDGRNESDDGDSGHFEQEALHDESFQDSLRVSEQLQRETEDVSGRTLVEAANAPDLPTLPKDLSTCSVLTRETATVGSIIAFKQFEMSADTNWQPRISDYRTAVIREVLDEGSLQMELAKRDQPGKDSQYDQQTGERIYGKFEMPGYDEEDDSSGSGRITIPFEELIDPIIVPAPNEGHGQGDSQQVQTAEQSLIQENEDNQDKDQTIQEEESNAGEDDKDHQDNGKPIQIKDPSAFQDNKTAQAGQTQVEDLSNYHDGSNDTLTLRGEHDTASQQPAALDGAAEIMEAQPAAPSEETRQEISELIRDAGWRSGIGPGLNRRLALNGDEDVSAKEDKAPTDTPSPQSRGYSSSQPYSAVDVASSPLRTDIQIAEPEQGPDFDIAESVPPSNIPHLDATSMASDTKMIVEYPDLPPMGDDSDLFQEEAQHRSTPHNIDHDLPSQDLSSLNGMYHSPAQSTRSRTHFSREIHSPNIAKLLEPSSDDEFPPLFSQAFEARMSQDIEIKSEFSSQEPSISPPAKRKVENKSKLNGIYTSSSLRETNRDWRPDGQWSGLDDDEDDNNEEDSRSTPRPSQRQDSQIPAGSQVIDLTLSSDLPHTIYEDDDDDSFVLGKGPGWVKKRKSSGPRNVGVKANPGRRKTVRG